MMTSESTSQKLSEAGKKGAAARRAKGSSVQQQQQPQPRGGRRGGAGANFDYAQQVQTVFAECTTMLIERLNTINAKALQQGWNPGGGASSA